MERSRASRSAAEPPDLVDHGEVFHDLRFRKSNDQLPGARCSIVQPCYESCVPRLGDAGPAVGDGGADGGLGMTIDANASDKPSDPLFEDSQPQPAPPQQPYASVPPMATDVSGGPAPARFDGAFGPGNHDSASELRTRRFVFAGVLGCALAGGFFAATGVEGLRAMASQVRSFAWHEAAPPPPAPAAPLEAPKPPEPAPSAEPPKALAAPPPTGIPSATPPPAKKKKHRKSHP
jgi:hypothetical protein